MNIDAIVKQLLTEMLPTHMLISEEMDVQNDLGIDSYGCVELLIKIEDALNIMFSPSQLNISNLKTVGDFINIAKEAKS